MCTVGGGEDEEVKPVSKYPQVYIRLQTEVLHKELIQCGTLFRSDGKGITERVANVSRPPPQFTILGHTFIKSLCPFSFLFQSLRDLVVELHEVLCIFFLSLVRWAATA